MSGGVSCGVPPVAARSTTTLPETALALIASARSPSLSCPPGRLEPGRVTPRPSMTTWPEAVCAVTSKPPPAGMRTVTSPETELELIWAAPLVRARAMSPLTVLSLIDPSRLAWTVTGPLTDLPVKLPVRPWHSTSPLTVLALTSPAMSSSVSAPETVLALTSARTPLTRASALTVLTLTSAAAGTDRLTRARSRWLPKEAKLCLRLSNRLSASSLMWLTLRVEPVQVTWRGRPTTSCTSSRAVLESSCVTLSTCPPTRPTLSLWTVSPSPPMSRTLGPSISHCCAMPRSLAEVFDALYRVLDGHVISRCIASARVLVDGATRGSDTSSGRRTGRCCPFTRREGAATSSSARRVSVVRARGARRCRSVLDEVPAVAGGQVGLPLLVPQEGVEAVDVRDRATRAHVALGLDDDLEPVVEVLVPGRRRADHERRDPCGRGVVEDVGQGQPQAGGRHAVVHVVGADPDDQPSLRALGPARTALRTPAGEDVRGGVAAHAQVVCREVHVRVRGATHDPGHPAQALGVAVAGDVGVADEHHPDVPRALGHVELGRGGELGRDVVRVLVGEVVHKAHAVRPRRRRAAPARWQSARWGSRTRGSGRRTSAAGRPATRG